MRNSFGPEGIIRFVEGYVGTNVLGDTGILSNMCLAYFWGSCLKRCFYKFIKEIHLTSCEDHSWGIVSTFF